MEIKTKKGRKRFSEPLYCADRSGAEKVNIMGGTVIETESEKLIRQGISQGEAKMLIEMGQEYGLDDATLLKKMQDKIGLSLKQATAYLEQYSKRAV